MGKKKRSNGGKGSTSVPPTPRLQLSPVFFSHPYFRIGGTETSVPKASSSELAIGTHGLQPHAFREWGIAPFFFFLFFFLIWVKTEADWFFIYLTGSRHPCTYLPNERGSIER